MAEQTILIVEDDPQKPTRICTVWGKGYRFVSGEEGGL